MIKSRKDLSKYDGKYVRLTDKYGDTYTGEASYGGEEFLMHEYGGDEDGLFIGDFLVYRSQIASIEETEGETTMTFEKLAAEKRYSCRGFAETPIDQADLDKILEAGRNAPTARNNQPQRILVIRTPEGMRKLAECTPYTYGAPAALVVCYDSKELWVRIYDGKDSGDIDASIVTTQMMLQAADLGLATCWLGHFDPALIRELFNIPENIVPVAILDLGYPDEKGKRPSSWHWKRKDLSEIVVYESF